MFHASPDTSAYSKTLAAQIENDIINKLVDDIAALASDLVRGICVKYSAANGRWEACDGTVALEATDAIGIVEYVGSPDTGGQVRVAGVYTNDDLAANTKHYCQADGSLDATETAVYIGRTTSAGRLVMAQGRASGSGASLPGFIGNKFIITSNTGATITADYACLWDADVNPKIVPSINCTLNTGTVGANGLDTGSLSNSAWYYPYVIYNPTADTTACLMSASATSPTLPSGYTFFARLPTALRTDASGYLMRTKNAGRRTQYVVTTGSNTAAMPLMASGGGGTINISSFAPPTAIIFRGVVQNTSGNVEISPNSSYSNDPLGTNPPLVSPQATNYYYKGTIPFSYVIESATLYYAGDNHRIYAIGWEE